MYNKKLFLVLNNLRAGEWVQLFVVLFFRTQKTQNLKYLQDAIYRTLTFQWVRNISICSVYLAQNTFY